MPLCAGQQCIRSTQFTQKSSIFLWGLHQQQWWWSLCPSLLQLLMIMPHLPHSLICGYIYSLNCYICVSERTNERASVCIATCTNAPNSRANTCCIQRNFNKGPQLQQQQQQQQKKDRLPNHTDTVHHRGAGNWRRTADLGTQTHTQPVCVPKQLQLQ